MTSGAPTRRIDVRFQGHVQGVGFRFTTVHIAEGFNVGGYVRNLPDGDVEMVAEGSEEDLNAFLGAIRTSHIHRFVLREQVAWGEARGSFRGFGVKY